jgi:hypothetical protein
LIDALKKLGIAKFTDPVPGELKTDREIKAALEADQHLVHGTMIADRFEMELIAFRAMVARNLDEAHALLNGKWLVEHLGPTATGWTKARCRADWIAHAISVGGLPEVRDWWERVTGSPPSSVDQ